MSFSAIIERLSTPPPRTAASPGGGWGQAPFVSLAVAALYTATALLGFTMAIPPGNVTAVWPPSGIAFAAALRLGSPALAGVWLGSLLANLIWARGIGGLELVFVCAAIAAGSAAQAGLGAALIRRWTSADTPFARPRDAFKFMLAAAAACTVAASLGTASLAAAGRLSASAFAATWWTWWMGDLGGVILVTPFALALPQAARREWTARSLAERALFAASLLAVCALMFSAGPLQQPVMYLLLPLLLWSSFRYGLLETSSYLLLVAGFAVWSTVEGRGPFAQGAPAQALLNLQVFLATRAAACLILCAAISDERASRADLRRAQDTLEELVRARTAALLKSEREVREYIDHMSTFNAKVAPDGTILLVNRAAELASGLSHEQLLKTNFLEGHWWSFDPEVQERVKRAFARARAGETVTYDEKVLIFGQVSVINFGLKPVLGPGGGVRYVVAEGRDITALREAKDQLDSIGRELARSNDELNQFATVASHDLQEPLRKIEAFGERLRERCAAGLGEEGADYLGRMLGACEHMRRLITDLLALARVSSRAAPPEPVGLDQVAGEVLANLEAAIAASGGSVEISSPLPRVMADPSQMRQLLQNLIGNALKFRLPGRPPLVRVAGRPLEKGMIELSVEDNGAGFDNKFADRLFKPFQRLHSRVQYEGTGMGLAICEKIARRHGGTIAASGGVGKGARFIVTLPAPSEPGEESS